VHRGEMKVLVRAFGVGLMLACGGGAFAADAALVASPEAGWPQFRGPRRDGISDERGLLGTWPEGGPKLLWTAKGAGKGFSSTIIAGGRLYVTGDFDAELRVMAFDLQGQQLWSVRHGDAWLNQYQGARASVTYRAGFLYLQNAHGRIACLEAATGKEVWAVDLMKRFGAENITWGFSECLLVDERAVYATAGGRDAMIVALDRRTGDVVWKTAQLDPAAENLESASYAAPILVQFAGRRLVIGCTQRQLYCVDAASGALQWTRPRVTTYSVLAISPVLVGDAIFMTAPIGPPGQLYHLIAPKRAGEPVGVIDGWTTALDTCQGGVLHVAGRLYGATYPKRGSWQARDATDGRLLYETSDFLKGGASYADGRLYALAEDGWMLLLEPTDKEFAVRGRFRLAEARDRNAWAHPVIFDGRLYLRYLDTISCYDIRADHSPRKS
jgi:outer membrane protein assembly factor BamB